MGAFVPSDGSVVENPTGGVIFGPGYDTSLSRCAIDVGVTGSTGAYAESAHWTAADDIWVHWMQQMTGGPPAPLGDQTPSYTMFEVWSDSALILRILAGSKMGQEGVFLQMQLNSGTTDVGAEFNISTGTPLQVFDLHVSATLIEIYVAGTLRASATGTFSSVADMTYVRHVCPYVPIKVSQSIVADDDTVSFSLQTLPITGAGALQQWSGVYTDVNEIIYNDGSFIFSDTADQVATYVHDTTVIDTVRAVVVTARAAKGSAGPQNLQLALTSGAGTYFSGTKTLTSGYTANEGIWATNPNGGGAWTPTDVEAIEYGVKSIA